MKDATAFLFFFDSRQDLNGFDFFEWFHLVVNFHSVTWRALSEHAVVSFSGVYGCLRRPEIEDLNLN